MSTPYYLQAAQYKIREAERLEQIAADLRRGAVGCLANGLKRRVREFDPNDVNFCLCGRYAEQRDDGGDVWLCARCLKKMAKGGAE